MTGLAFLVGLGCGVPLGYVWARRVWRGLAERMALSQSRLLQRSEPRVLRVVK